MLLTPRTKSSLRWCYIKSKTWLYATSCYSYSYKYLQSILTIQVYDVTLVLNRTTQNKWLHMQSHTKDSAHSCTTSMLFPFRERKCKGYFIWLPSFLRQRVGANAGSRYWRPIGYSIEGPWSTALKVPGALPMGCNSEGLWATLLKASWLLCQRPLD